MSPALARRVLVVDDHLDAADASCLLLRVLGHTARPAVNGGQALQEVERFLPDVVICDIGLPDISGYEVAAKIRQRHGPRVFLAALSGWSQPEARVRSISAGFDEHWIKPANAKLLSSILAAATRHDRLSHELRDPLT
jgi:CheY-like chemotaxis protein